MATIRNIAGDARWIPYANAEVEDGETFEVDDEDFAHMHFHPDLFKVVTPPVRVLAAKKAARTRKRAAKKAAAPKPEQPAVVDDGADPDDGQPPLTDPNEVTE